MVNTGNHGTEEIADIVHGSDKHPRVGYGVTIVAGFWWVHRVLKLSALRIFIVIYHR